MLATSRYCPRCDKVTRWTNEHDHALTLACTGDGCGLVAGAPLTAEEQRRLERYYDRPVAIARRPYELV